jgi:hypothetical protein
LPPWPPYPSSANQFLTQTMEHRLQVLAKAEQDVLKRHQLEKDRVRQRKALLAPKDADFYQEWWDTLSSDALLLLFNSILRPGFQWRLATFLRVSSSDQRDFKRLLECDAMQFLLRNRLEETGYDRSGLYKRMTKIENPEVFLPTKRWWRRDRDPGKKLLDRDIRAVPAPNDFFRDVWFDAFSTESKMAGSPIDTLYSGLGKHAFTAVVDEIRVRMYGFDTRPGMYADTLQRDRIARLEEEDGSYRKRKRQETEEEEEEDSIFKILLPGW